jgi:hypothetical protein
MFQFSTEIPVQWADGSLGADNPPTPFFIEDNECPFDMNDVNHHTMPALLSYFVIFVTIVCTSGITVYIADKYGRYQKFEKTRG